MARRAIGGWARRGGFERCAWDRSVVATYVPDEKAERIEQDNVRVEDLILLALNDDGKLSIRDLCQRVGGDLINDEGKPKHTSCSRILERLKSEQLLRKTRQGVWKVDLKKADLKLDE